MENPMTKKQSKRTKDSLVQYIAIAAFGVIYSWLVLALMVFGVIMLVSLFFVGGGLAVQLQMAGIGIGAIVMGILPTALFSKKLFGKRTFFVPIVWSPH